MADVMQDRETFERQLLQPPHAARLMGRAKPFIERLSPSDGEALLKIALDYFWDGRDQIKDAADIVKLWSKALEYSARRRPRWRLWWSTGPEWVRGNQLGKEFV